MQIEAMLSSLSIKIHFVFIQVKLQSYDISFVIFGKELLFWFSLCFKNFITYSVLNYRRFQAYRLDIYEDTLEFKYP